MSYKIYLLITEKMSTKESIRMNYMEWFKLYVLITEKESIVAQQTNHAKELIILLAGKRGI